LETPHIE
jgi:hypothetical protein